MRTFHSVIRVVLRHSAMPVCFFVSSVISWGAGLAGDTIQGNLTIPTAPGSGNYFTQDPNGFPTSSLPISAVVGSGIEFTYDPQQISTYVWRLTVDVSNNQIAINEMLSDPNPDYSLGEFTSWTLTLTDLDWAGTGGIGSAAYVLHDPQIELQAFTAHSIQFAIGEIVVTPTGPYSISRTTVVELSPIPEPSSAALVFGCVVAIVCRRRSTGSA